MDNTKPLKIACFNVRGIMSCTKYLGTLLDDQSIDIIGICEHWLFPNSLQYIQTLHTDFDGFGGCSTKCDALTSHHRGQGGVAFMYRKSLTPLITAIDIEDDRICGLAVKLNDGMMLKVFMVYLPSSNYCSAVYSGYLEKLYDIYHTHLDEQSECIIMGDFNCEIRGDKCNRCTPTRGNLLTSFLHDTSYTSVNIKDLCTGPNYTFDPMDTHQNTTHIDHILVESCRMSWVNNCMIVDEECNTSDHLPICIELSIPLVQNIPTATFKRVCLKWNSYTKDDIFTLYTLKLQEALDKICIPDAESATISQTEEYYNSIVSTLKICALQNIKQKQYMVHAKPFWNRALKDLYNNMRLQRQHWVKESRPRSPFSSSYFEYKNAKRLFRREMRNQELQWQKREYEEIEKSCEMDQHTFWKLVKRKQQKGPSKAYEMKFENGTCHTAEEISTGWANYFTKLYDKLESQEFDSEFKTEVENSLLQIKACPCDFTGILDCEVTKEETAEAIRGLNLGKAGGDDSLTNEHIIYGGPALAIHLSTLYSLILRCEQVPAIMKTGLTVTLLKPGKKVKTDPDAYRGITLLQVIYKLFEKITLKRMQAYFKSIKKVFPDPLQYAYQEKLSSLNATFGIQETINYNTERGSKVFVCLMDNRKAFDIVWHSGLFVSLHELGITGKLWRVIIDSYTGMTNTVLYKGCQSKPFNILQSSRQGSLWGGFFYLILINMVIQEVRNMDIGAYVGSIFSGIHVQADDIALVATSRKHLQLMIDKVNRLSCMWRFLIHPGKTKVLVYNETLHNHKLNMQNREWNVGPNRTYEVDSHIHCGVTLTTASSTVLRTKDACRKGRGVMLALCNNIIRDHQLNPITCLKLYKSVVLPSALFGCELWNDLTETEKVMLERLQRFCAKKIQHFGRRTHSDICCPMLGLSTVEAYMDSMKLKFLRRILMLPSHCTSKQILLQRLYQCKFLPNLVTGYSGEIERLCNKYGLQGYLDEYLVNMTFPAKIPWKHIVANSVKEQEVLRYRRSTENDSDFTRFTKAHPDPTIPSPIWRVAYSHPHMLQRCFQAAKALAYPHIWDTGILCEYCGIVTMDYLEHYTLSCTHTSDERDTMWQIITNSLDVEISAYLNNLPDEEFLVILLGGPGCVLTDIKTHVAFMVISVNFLSKVLNKINVSQD